MQWLDVVGVALMNRIDSVVRAMAGLLPSTVKGAELTPPPPPPHDVVTSWL